MAQVPYWIVINKAGECGSDDGGTAWILSRKDGVWTRNDYTFDQNDTAIGSGLTADDGTEVTAELAWTEAGVVCSRVHATFTLDQSEATKRITVSGPQVGTVAGFKFTEVDPTPP